MKSASSLQPFFLTLIVFNIYGNGSFRSGTEHSHSIAVSCGMEPYVYTEIEYSRLLQNELFIKNVHLFFDLNIPLFASFGATSFPSFQIGFGMCGSLLAKGNVSLDVSIGTGIALANNVNGRFVSLRVNPAVNFQYDFKSVSTGIKISYKTSMLTHIHHSHFVHKTFKDRYPAESHEKNSGPKDGWYRMSANNFNYGIELGVHILTKATMVIDGGLISTPDKKRLFMFADIGDIPFYASLKVIFHLKNNYI